MIQVLLVRSQNGSLQSCTAEGHAGFAKKGYDIVCASVTSLLRTVALVLENKPTVELDEKTFGRGSLAISVKKHSGDDESLLQYSFDFLNVGLSQLQKDYPDCVELRVENSNFIAEA